MFGSFLPSLSVVWRSPESTRAWEPTLLGNHPHSLTALPQKWCNLIMYVKACLSPMMLGGARRNSTESLPASRFIHFFGELGRKLVVRCAHWSDRNRLAVF